MDCLCYKISETGKKTTRRPPLYKKDLENVLNTANLLRNSIFITTSEDMFPNDEK